MQYVTTYQRYNNGYEACATFTRKIDEQSNKTGLCQFM